MTDLNAPLGQSGRKPAGPRARPPRPSEPAARRSGGAVLAASVTFACIVALNAYAFAERDKLPGSAPIVLSAPRMASADTGAVTGSVADPAGETDGVKVVYGLTDNTTDSGGMAGRSPEPTSSMPEGRISEGGPKVIVVHDPGDAAVGQPIQLAHLPDDAALEATKWGELPMRTADGRRPMDIYARPWSTAGGKRIAIVIGGLGLSQTGTQRALKDLPPEITLAFAPQGYSLGRWMRKARSQGHELLVQVPMEPFDYPKNDPGPQTLTVAAGEDANLANLRSALASITNYTGIMNYQGARFATSQEAMGPVLREVSERGLLYLNDGTAGGDGLRRLARTYDVPYVSGQVILDATRDPAAIKARLKELEKIAEANGSAIGSGSALEVTVETVAAWANGAKKRGFEIVGVSALTR